jgi:hypothetical protein
LLGKLDNKKRIVYKDYKDRAIELRKRTIESHLKDTEKYKDRYKYAGNIADILKNPDEIWLSKGQKGNYTYSYIKFYADKMIVVIIDIKAGKPMNIKTFFKIDINKESSQRNGILVKKISHK